MNPGRLPPVTVLIDRHDHPDWTTAALAAHHPAQGGITVHPATANGAPAALAHDLLYALGKRLPTGGASYGTWADSLQPAWDAATAWTLAHHIEHLIICRTDRLTHARHRQLLTLRERTGVHLTLLWHHPADPALRTLLDQTPHRLIETLPEARTALKQTSRRPSGVKIPAQPQQAKATPCQDDRQWITRLPHPGGTPVTRPPRAPCPGAHHIPYLPTAPAEQTHETVLAKRLHQIAHPLHAAALTIHAITGASTDQLALIRGTDINDWPRILKTHDSPAHRHCQIHPVPGWARPLLTAAKTHGRLQNRAPDSPLLPLINSQNSEQLRHTATAIHYHLKSP